MNPQFQSWRRSSHASVGCVDCHSGGSLTLKLMAPVVWGARHLDDEITGKFAKPIDITGLAIIPDSACLGCHSPRKRWQSDRLAMDHDAHKKLPIRCITCHNRVAHPRAEKYAPIRSWASKYKYPDYLSMRGGCWRCHRAGRDFVDVWGRLHAGPYRTRDGRRAPTSCKSCHPRFAFTQLTARIHNVRAKHHNAEWRKGRVHGERARKEDFIVCQVCHNPAKRCTVCHRGITMPHPVNWRRWHGPTAKQSNSYACHLCHGVIKTVPSCSANGHHHEEIVQRYRFNLVEAPWASGLQRHGIVALKESGTCFRCHDQATWCTTQCHAGITMPHDSNWKKVHFTKVGFVKGEGWQAKSAPCTMCHNPDGNNRLYCFRCHHAEFGPDKTVSQWALMRWVYIAFGPNAQTSTPLPCPRCHGDLKLCADCHQDRTDRNRRFENY